MWVQVPPASRSADRPHGGRHSTAGQCNGISHHAVIRGGVVGGRSESSRASPVGFGFRVVASAASMARSLAKPHKKTDRFQ